MLRKILGPKRDKVTGEWRGLPNEELHDLYFSPNVIRVIKRVRWVGHVAYMWKRGVVYEILVENLKGRGHLVDLDINRWIILKCMLRKEDGKSCTGFIWLETGTVQVAGCCGYGTATFRLWAVVGMELLHSGCGLLWVWNCYIQVVGCGGCGTATFRL